MKLSTIMPIMAILALINFTSCSTESLPDEDANAINLQNAPVAKDIEIQILDLINAHRQEKGLVPLQNHNVIKSVAFSHTDYMIEVDNVSHDNFFERKNSLQQHANATKVS